MYDFNNFGYILISLVICTDIIYLTELISNIYEHYC